MLSQRRMTFLILSLLITVGGLGFLLSRAKPKTPNQPVTPFKATCTPAELEKLYSTAVVVPHVADAQVNGFIFTKIEPGSPWAKWGFIEKDVAVTINGEALTDPQTFLSGVGALCAKGAKIGFTRSGEEKMVVVD